MVRAKKIKGAIMEIAIIPQPVSLTRREGQCSLKDAAIYAGAGALETAALLQELLPGSVVNPAAQPAGASRLELTLSPALERLASEGYRLEIEPGRVVLSAAQAAGLFYGSQSLRQLLPVSGEAVIPCLEIEDFPRFGWRGAMLDSCRHFFPVETVLRFIDLLALHKLNRLHWHLTDDQGWRLQIERYPRLTEVGAWRKETMVGHYEEWLQTHQFDGIPYGGFYTKADIRRVLDFARMRHVTVVPEIEMPGHAQAAVASYPELGNVSQPVEVSKGWGIHLDVYNVEESTLRFLQNVLDEVIDLFPSQFIHIGGDECPKQQWHESPAAQARMQALGLKDEEELQSFFVRRMDAFLFARGRRLIGWDEILEGGLASGAAVMSWRGEEGGIAAANAGHDVVMAPNTYTYLDYYQSAEREKEPLGIGGYLPLETVYNYEPIPAEIDPAKRHHILGTQAQLWAEYIPTSAQLEYMAFPRLSALSEVAWSPAGSKDYRNFLARLKENLLPRLDRLQVNYRPLDQ
jgi:hexosaminidase